MIANYVSPVLTPVTPENASRAYRTALTNLVRAPSDMAVAILHAQGALETWHFKSCWNGNAGNIKAGELYEGSYTCIKLNEVLNGRTVWFSPTGEIDGKDGPVKGRALALPPGHPQTRMRAYSSLASGVMDKIRFLTGPRWLKALNMALAGDAAGYVTAVRAAGYFTAPLDPYLRSVVQLTAKYLPVAVATARAESSPLVPADDDALCQDIAACHRFELPPGLAARLRAQQAEHVHDVMDRLREERDRELQGWADETEPTQPETPEAKSDEPQR